MPRRPVKIDFNVEASEDVVVVHFWPTKSVFTFNSFTRVKDIADFGPISLDPIEQHAFRHAGIRGYVAAEVRAMAFSLATEAIAATSSGRLD